MRRVVTHIGVPYDWRIEIKGADIMAKNRTIPFGYCMRNGKIIVDLTESKAVVRIFEEYLNGSSLLQIAKLMDFEKI